MPKKKKVKIKIEEKEISSSLKSFSIKHFGKYVDKYGLYFAGLKDELLSSGIGFLFRTYLSISFFITSLVFLLSIISFIIISAVFNFDILISVSAFFFSLIITIGAFTFLYFYPSIRTSSRKSDIEANLPFAITHMSAIASSGVPPYAMFKILSKFREYGEISKEAGKIVRDMDVFGLNEIAALKEVIAKTPSQDFKELLEGVLSTMQTGGSLQSYLKQQAEKAVFEYRLKRERYTETLSVYADIYTALLIAAPLLFITILSVLNFIGGQVFGLGIQDVINLLIFLLIPSLNIAFLIFIDLTQPKL